MEKNLFLDQEVYNRIKTRAAGKLVQPSFLQLEIALQNGKTNYQFGVSTTDQSPSMRASERRLNQNDAFVICYRGLFLKKEDASKPGSAVLQTYPNPTVFPDAPNEVNTADLEAVFNSFLSVKVGDTVFAEAIDMGLSRVVNTTVQSDATKIPLSERKGMDGYIAQTPIITLDGGKKNQLILNIPTWAGQLIQYSSAATRNYVVLKLEGFLITDGSGVGSL